MPTSERMAKRLIERHKLSQCCEELGLSHEDCLDLVEEFGEVACKILRRLHECCCPDEDDEEAGGANPRPDPDWPDDPRRAKSEPTPPPPPPEEARPTTRTPPPAPPPPPAKRPGTRGR